MYKINDVVVYRRTVCKIIAMSRNQKTGEDCYVMVPYNQQDGLTKMCVPVSNKAGHLRNLMTKEEIDALLDRVPSIETLPRKAANMKSQYTTMLASDQVDDLVRIIKTCWRRNQARAEQHKRMASVDDEYLQKAERFLFEEMHTVLGDEEYVKAKSRFVEQCEKDEAQ